MTNFTMIKKILISFILAVLVIPFTGAENRAYKVLWERSLWEFKNDRAERVTGYLPDGTRVTGTKDGFGNVRGDDGKTYKIN